MNRWRNHLKLANANESFFIWLSVSLLFLSRAYFYSIHSESFQFVVLAVCVEYSDLH